jgi:hypothetical protein
MPRRLWYKRWLKSIILIGKSDEKPELLCLARVLAINPEVPEHEETASYVGGDPANRPPVRDDSTPPARAQGRSGGDLTRRRTTLARIRVRHV